MQQNNRVKICPDCSFANAVNRTHCADCGKSLAGVRPELQEQEASLADEATLVAPIPVSEAESQQTVLLDEPPPVQASHNPFVKKIANVRTNLKQRSSWFVIVALLLVFLAILLPLIILLPRIKGNGGNAVTPTAIPTRTAGPLQLPNGLGEFTTANGQNVGVNDGSFAPFDIGRDPKEMAFKQQAAQSLQKGNPQSAQALWYQALSVDSSDAEVLIYLEDLSVKSSGAPFITLVAGTSFTPPFPDGQYASELQGIYVAQHEFNSGNHAFKLRILIANSGSDVNENDVPAVARQIVQVVHKDPSVIGVIGWLNSSNTINALDPLANAKIPIISPQASSDHLTGISRYFFRIVAPNSVQAQVAAQFMKTVLHSKNPVVFVDPGDAYSQNLAQDFESAFVAGGSLPEELFKTDNTKSFSSLVHDALKYHPDAFFFTSPSSVDAGLFQDALPTTGAYASLPAVGGDGGYAVHPNSRNRWFFTEYAYHGESNIPIAQQFAQEYTADFDPGPNPQKKAGYYGYSLANDHAILAYDATSVVLTALQMAYTHGKTTLTSQVLTDALPQITGANAFQGVSGQIAFGADHDPINKAIVILNVSKDGHILLYSVQHCFVKGCAQG